MDNFLLWGNTETSWEASAPQANKKLDISTPVGKSETPSLQNLHAQHNTKSGKMLRKPLSFSLGRERVGTNICHPNFSGGFPEHWLLFWHSWSTGGIQNTLATWKTTDTAVSDSSCHSPFLQQAQNKWIKKKKNLSSYIWVCKELVCASSAPHFLEATQRTGFCLGVLMGPDII